MCHGSAIIARLVLFVKPKEMCSKLYFVMIVIALSTSNASFLLFHRSLKLNGVAPIACSFLNPKEERGSINS